MTPEKPADRPLTESERRAWAHCRERLHDLYVRLLEIQVKLDAGAKK